MNGLNQMNNPVVNLHFGPEQENVLPTIESNWTFLNLRANRFMTTTSHPDFESRAFHDWQRENGADLVATVGDVAATGERLPALIGYGMATAPAIANGLDNNLPADIWYNWNLMVNEPESRSYPVKAPNGGQDTYYFRTSNDAWGVLEIIGFNENPRGVKIRYKLVETGKNMKPLMDMDEHRSGGLDFGLRWEAERHTALARTERIICSIVTVRPKAPSPRCSAGAVQDASCGAYALETRAHSRHSNQSLFRIRVHLCFICG